MEAPALLALNCTNVCELFSYHISAICVAYLVSTLQALNLTVRSELYVNDCIITDKSFQYVTLPTLSL